jgi:hypothetical protein
MVSALVITNLLFLIAAIILGFKYEAKCSEASDLSYKLSVKDTLVKVQERRHQDALNRISITQHALKKSRKQKEQAYARIKDLTTEEQFFEFMNEVEG